MEKDIRVRFAPSPTGPLHMGGVRTALYNYLFAKQAFGGKFIIRIEDTDSTRFVPGAEKYIIEALNWCGIIPDEGIDKDGNVVETPSEEHPYAPYRQSQRKPLYKKYAEQLVENGYAYYAFDSAEELAAKRNEAQEKKDNFIYNRFTRESMNNSLTKTPEETKDLLENTTDWTIRFKMPADTVVKMNDEIRGHIEMNTDTLDDKVLWKRADELPTYHLANIVDDHLMKISHVIRGEEWLPSLPLHYMLYKAFGWEETMPKFAHLSLLLKPSGKGKLSKRDGDKLGFPVFPLQWVNDKGEVTRGYREDGYFPEAFVNLLALLGWNPGNDQELFTMDELIEQFSLKRVVKSGARFNPEKAHWFNKEYLRKKSDEELTELAMKMLEKHELQIVECGKCALVAGADLTRQGTDFANKIFTYDYILSIVSLIKERASFVEDFWDIASYMFISPEEFEKYGIKISSNKPSNGRKPDPRAKVYDDEATKPFAAKDVSKFWKADNRERFPMVIDFIKNYDGEFTKEDFEVALEEFIKGNEWPMGKVMNCIRLSLAGSSNGLGIADIVTRLGKKESIKRMNYFVETLGNQDY